LSQSTACWSIRGSLEISGTNCSGGGFEAASTTAIAAQKRTWTLYLSPNCVFAENPRSQQPAIVYGGAWGEAADANKMNWPVPVLLVRLPGTHTVSSKFWG
jgi:hypothetical protein